MAINNNFAQTLLGPLVSASKSIDNRVGAVPGSQAALLTGAANLNTGFIGNVASNLMSKIPGSPGTVRNITPVSTGGVFSKNNYDKSGKLISSTGQNTINMINPNTGLEINQTLDDWIANGNIDPVPEDSPYRYKNSRQAKKAAGWKNLTTPAIKGNDPYFIKTAEERAAQNVAPLADPNAPQMRGANYNWNGPQVAPTARAPQTDLLSSLLSGKPGGVLGPNFIPNFLSPFMALVPGSNNSVWGPGPNTGGSPSSSFNTGTVGTGNSTYNMGKYGDNIGISGTGSSAGGSNTGGSSYGGSSYGGSSSTGGFGTAGGLGGESNSFSDDMSVSD